MSILRRNKAAPAGGSVAAAVPSFDFKPTAFPKAESQGVLIAAKQLPGFPTAAGLLANALAVRGDRIWIDYTAAAASVRFRVDGVWENKDPMERAAGDAALVVIKRLFGMEPNERKARQVGSCVLSEKKGDWVAECTSQGVSGGERVLISIEPKKPTLKTLEELGMRDQTRETFRGLINAHDGIVLISAPPGHGLPTTWRIAIDTADKFVSDWVSLEDAASPEPEIINVTAHRFDSAEGEKPHERLYKALLKQPDVFVMPQLYNEEVVRQVLDQLQSGGKHAVTRITARDAVDGVLQLLTANRKHAVELLKSLTGVLNQRLVRRLCTACRQPFAPSPQLLQKLGIPAGRVSQLYQPTVIPPGQQATDEKGNSVPPCSECGGRGYKGRFAIFELLKLDDSLRKVVMQQAKNPDAIRQFAKQKGHVGLQEEGVLSVAMGHTSLQELQRVLSGK